MLKCCQRMILMEMVSQNYFFSAEPNSTSHVGKTEPLKVFGKEMTLHLCFSRCRWKEMLDLLLGIALRLQVIRRSGEKARAAPIFCAGLATQFTAVTLAVPGLKREPESTHMRLLITSRNPEACKNG